MRLICLSILIALMPVSLAGCKEQDAVVYVISDFERKVDKAIEATGGEDQEKAVLSIKDIKGDWTVFTARYSSYGDDQVAWQRGMGRVTDVISKADSYGNSLMFGKARDELKKLAPMFRKLRRENDVTYIPDLLHSYEIAQARLVKSMDDGTLTDDEFAGLDKLRKEASLRWKAVVDAPVEAKLYGFTEEKERAYLEAVDVLDHAIDRIDVAVKSGDRALVMKALRQAPVFYEKVSALFSTEQSPDEEDE